MTASQAPAFSPPQLPAELEGTVDVPRGSRSRRRGWLVRRALATADVLGLAAAFALAEWWFAGGSSLPAASQIDPRVEMLLFLITLPGWVILAKLYGLYDRDEERTDHSTVDDFGGVVHMITLGTWAAFLTAWATKLVHPQAGKLIAFWGLSILLVCTLRATARAYCHRQAAYLQNTVIVGAGDVGQLIAKKYLKHPEYGINLVGFVDTNPKVRREGLHGLTLLGGPEDLPSLIRSFDVERVVIAFSNEAHEETLDLIRATRDFDVQVDVVPRLFEIVGPGVEVHTIEGLPLLGLAPPRLPGSSRLLKRTLDVAVSGVALVALAPVFAIIALLVKIDSPGPTLYRHRRIGQGGQPVDVLKFRSMRSECCRGERYGGAAAEAAFAKLMTDADRQAEFAATYKLRDDPRITRVGRFLRKTSLDELPQLVNALRGELSLVGPRPLVAGELELYYGDAAPTLLATRPGITGYWQINGRSELEYADRVRLDLSYAENWSLSLDLKILAKTVRTLVGSRGAY